MAVPAKKLSVLLAESEPSDSATEISTIDFALSNNPSPTPSGPQWNALKVFLSAMPAPVSQEDSSEGLSEDMDEYLDRNRQDLSTEISNFQRFVNLKSTVDLSLIHI